MPAPARQLYTGKLYPPDKWVQDASIRGQVSPRTEERFRKMNGRYLSGLGESPDGLGSEDYGGSIGDDPNYPNPELSTLESQDDTYGSGIFSASDDYTANSDTGIFASNYSLPGYMGREVPYAVSRDVTDIANDGEVVYVPGGGLNYVAEYPPPVLGPTPRPPRQLGVRPTTGESYVNIAPGPALAPLNQHAPLAAPMYAPLRDDRGSVLPVPAWPQYRSLGQDAEPKEKPSTLAAFLWGGVAGAAAGFAWVLAEPWLKKQWARR